MGRASDTRSEARNWQELEEHCEALKADRDKWQKIAEDAIAQRDAARVEAQLRGRLITFTYEVPTRFRGVYRQAYDSGYHSAWRGRAYDNPYNNMHHQDAWGAGYRTAEQAFLLELSRVQKGEKGGNQ